MPGLAKGKVDSRVGRPAKFNADVVDTEALVDDLRQALEHSRAKLDAYLHTQELMLKGRSHDEYVATARRVGPYLTRRRGIRYEQENVGWLVDTIEVLTQRVNGRRTRKPRTPRKKVLT